MAGDAGLSSGHSTVDEPQSPVRHENAPVEFLAQPVQPHKAPDQELFT